MRCVNIDWLEVYACEDNMHYPMNAEYFRKQGYIVHEREYGTRVYSEMFTLEDNHGHNFLEVRRNPQSGSSSFTGLSELSCHLRLTNYACYDNNPVRLMADFMIKHGYVYQRIFRLDLCYDFVKFDSGDDPARFLRRYIENKFSKINQCKVRVIGDDSWASFDWESVSWGAPSSMVSTKMYNKTKELAATGNKKAWILQAWFESGLIADPINPPDVWRIEFSLKSSARNWIVIEDADAKHLRKKAVPHTLDMFDGRDKLWMRFEELAHHYFQFRYVEYLDKVNSDGERCLKRKDVCREKKLFSYNLDREFYQIDGVAKESQVDRKDIALRKQLQRYRERHADVDIRNAIDIILNNLDRDRLRQITAHGYAHEIEAIRLAIATRTGWDYQRVITVAEEVHKLLEEGQIW